MALLLVILFVGIFFIQRESFYGNLARYCGDVLFNENQTEYSLSSLLADNNGDQRLEWYCQSLKKQNIYLQIKNQGKI